MEKQELPGYDFHRHLDICKQCRDNPFSLCDIGNELFKKVGKAINEMMNKLAD